MKASLILVSVAFLIAACSKQSDTPLQLNQAMEKAGNPDFNIQTKMLIQKHRKTFAGTALAQDAENVSDEEFTKDIEALTPPNLHALDPWSAKVALDQNIKKKNGGKNLIYNRDHVTIGSPLRLGRMQCYSGSILNLLVYRQLNARDFQALNMVMILTPGHILPGFMVREGNDFRLVGVESTVVGKGRTDFGLTKDLNIPIRVVDAEAFTQIEVLSDKLDDKAQVVKWALEETAKLYAIPLDKTEQAAAKEAPSTPFASVAADGANPLNASPFGFASAAEAPPAGDVERVERDDVPTNKGSVTDAFIQSEQSAPPSAKATGSTFSVGSVSMPMIRKSSSIEPKRLVGGLLFSREFLFVNHELPNYFKDQSCEKDVLANQALDDAIPRFNALLKTFRENGVDRESEKFQDSIRSAAGGQGFLVCKRDRCTAQLYVGEGSVSYGADGSDHRTVYLDSTDRDILFKYYDTKIEITISPRSIMIYSIAKSETLSIGGSHRMAAGPNSFCQINAR